MSGWDRAPEYGGRPFGWFSIVLSVAANLGVACALVMCSRSVNAQTPRAPIVGVASVIDGDTLEIHGQRVRLDGIDAPESGARCGEANIHQQAANALAERVSRRTVTCEPSGPPDRYGRTVARCSVGDENLNAWLVVNGWARDWPRYSRGRYASAEAEARAAQRGVWEPSCSATMWGDRNYSH
jgi:endonuclease YncB( thermonuclease family)